MVIAIGVSRVEETGAPASSQTATTSSLLVTHTHIAVARCVIRSFAHKLRPCPKMAVATDSPARPSANIRHPTAPSVLTMNGHFAAVGEKPTEEQFEHGVQVISEDQEFKSALRILPVRTQLIHMQSLFAKIPFS